MSGEQTTSAQADEARRARPLVDPTDYRLSGDGVTISYSATSISGQPLFSYKDATFDLSFIGDDIDVAESRMGTLVTVTLSPNNDAREIRLTLIVPLIKLHDGGETLRFTTFAIETTDRSGAFTLPPGPAGVLQTYRIHRLQGTAEHIES